MTWTMEMVHLLPAFGAGVDHDAEAALGIRAGSPLQRQLGRQRHDLPISAASSGVDLRHRRNVPLGHHHEMHRRPGMDVVEGEISSSS